LRKADNWHQQSQAKFSDFCVTIVQLLRFSRGIIMEKMRTYCGNLFAGEIGKNLSPGVTNLASKRT